MYRVNRTLSPIMMLVNAMWAADGRAMLEHRLVLAAGVFGVVAVRVMVE